MMRWPAANTGAIANFVIAHHSPGGGSGGVVDFGRGCGEFGLDVLGELQRARIVACGLFAQFWKFGGHGSSFPRETVLAGAPREGFKCGNADDAA